jgi:hypothetical protein
MDFLMQIFKGQEYQTMGSFSAN